MRGLSGFVLGVIACLAPITTVSAAGSTPEIRVLDSSVTDPSLTAITSGSLDDRFLPVAGSEASEHDSPYWVRLQYAGHSVADAKNADGSDVVPVLTLRKGRASRAQVYASNPIRTTPLPVAAQLPEFAGAQLAIFILPHPERSSNDSTTPRPLYVHMEPSAQSAQLPQFSISTLNEVLAGGAAHARMIALAFGALIAMALAGILIWLVLSERLFLLYGSLFSLQALYVVYLSGQGFQWPVLSHALALGAYTWNVPVGFSGAVACLFVREIADLRRFSPRVYTVFGWIAVAFVVTTCANVATAIGLESVVYAAGNVLFIGSAIFTLLVACLAWRRGSRAAGWFLLAWGLLEVFTILAAVQLLSNQGDGEALLYYGLPLSMVAAAVLVALGLADRLREQRAALTEAERRAQIDPLTGVLNRRSLLERLDAACLRAQARGLPIALMFIDLDHFKEINDSFGHPAGDACLAAIISPIQAELRQSDVIGRYGGEEFIVILSSADAVAAGPIAQRILERVAAVRVAGFGEPISLTCSIGVATSDMLGVWGEHLIAQADAAVYAAKRSGRNRVQFASALAA